MSSSEIGIFDGDLLEIGHISACAVKITFFFTFIIRNTVLPNYTVQCIDASLYIHVNNEFIFLSLFLNPSSLFPFISFS